MRGTGKAEVFAMLAHPVGHAKSPGMFNALFEKLGLDSLMVPVTCAPERLDEFWAGMDAMSNLRGVIVSIPYKVPMLAKAQTAHPRGARVGAANILRRLPSGAAEMLREDLEIKGPVRVSEVEAAEKEMLKTLRQLADDGKVALGGKGGDGFV